MPVLLISEADLPEEAYVEIAGKMTPLIREAKGLICHAGSPDPAGGWRGVEIWESEEDARSWFDHNIEPKLPIGVMPKHTFDPLRTASPNRRSPRRPLGWNAFVPSK
jgi:hypothetical protein